ncbi:MAG: imidazole glycerol phosphate synthase subunit HisH [Acidobacteriota bacterium]
MSDATSSPTSRSTPVTVIDAGVGNLGNLRRALESVGGEVEVTRDPEVVRRGGILVLPGVGAFKPPREQIRGAMEEALRDALDGGAHLLGICVGFQLLFESSSEFGETDGLGLLPGRVDRLPDTVRLPQIGWNALVERADHALLRGLGDDPHFYFVHSWAPVDVPPEARLAQAVHGASFTAVAGRGRVMGTQFHPEKSGPCGLRLLRNYLELASWAS